MTTTLERPAERRPANIPAAVGGIRAGVFTRWGDRKFRADIQGLRALAVILVVLYHATVPGFSGGFVGVDVFFVISGFLITRQLITEASVRGTVSISRFYAGRIRRLAPASLTVVVLTVVAAYFWGPALSATATAKDGLLAAVYSLNYGLAAQGVDYQHTTTSTSPLIHFWSLAVEEQFYILWPVLLVVVVLLTRGARARFRTAALVSVVFVIAALSLNNSIVVSAANPPLAYFSLQSRAWELAVGALIALGIPLLRRIPGALAAVLSWLGGAAILYSAFVFSDATAFPSYNALVPVLGAGLIITAGLLERRGSIETILRYRPMQFFGSVSYSWYLWHWPLIVLAPFLFDLTFGWPEKLEVVAVSLWISVLSYLIFEKSKKRSTISRRQWFSLGAAITATVAATCVVLSSVVPASIAGTIATPALLGTTTSAQQLIVQAAAKTTALPAKFSPSLARAGQDIPLVSDHCMLGLLEVTNDACVYGDPTAKRKIVLFGDSHAEQWFGALNKIGEDKGWQVIVWTKAGCGLSTIVEYSTVLKRNYSECATWQSNTLKRIAALRPEIIVASERTYGAAGKAPTIKATVAKLTKLAPTTVYLADTPLLTFDVPSCLAAHPHAVAQCAVTPFSVDSTVSRAKANRNATDVDVASLNVPVIDPSPWFCTATICPTEMGNTLVYRDNSHATQRFIIGLAPLLLAELTKIDPGFVKTS